MIKNILKSYKMNLRMNHSFSRFKLILTGKLNAEPYKSVYGSKKPKQTELVNVPLVF